MLRISRILAGAALIALGMVSASGARAANLGIVGGAGWTLNGDGSYSEGITGLSTAGGTLNIYDFQLTTAANFFDLSVILNTLKGGANTATWDFQLTGPIVPIVLTQNGKSADFTKSQAFPVGLYQIDLNVTSAGTSTFGGTIDINPVPIPGALPLFGTVIVGLGLYGMSRRKRNAA